MFYIQKDKEKTMKPDPTIIRINGPEDIPEHLAKLGNDGEPTVKIENGKVYTKHRERFGIGEWAEYKLGGIFKFEPISEISTSYGCWQIEKESRVQEKDGVFYVIPEPTPAEIASSVAPFFLKPLIGTDLTQNPETNEWILKVSWGEVTGYPDESIFVLYGMDPIDANILTIGTPSFDAYMLCTKDGDEICKLSDVIGAGRNLDTIAKVIEESLRRDEKQLIAAKIVGLQQAGIEIHEETFRRMLQSILGRELDKKDERLIKYINEALATDKVISIVQDQHQRILGLDTIANPEQIESWVEEMLKTASATKIMEQYEKDTLQFLTDFVEENLLQEDIIESKLRRAFEQINGVNRNMMDTTKSEQDGYNAGDDVENIDSEIE